MFAKREITRKRKKEKLCDVGALGSDRSRITSRLGDPRREPKREEKIGLRILGETSKKRTNAQR